ncbi:MAG: SRPBCC family protein [Hoeflea sp.]|uniref:SRPBCC family protein n=1 Tax=Hoeflea sp. TaxID=1940281 RepID=UPI003EF95B7E
MNAAQSRSTSNTVIVSQLIPASVDQVWSAWTVPSIKKRWWGRSENLELVLCEMDVRVGGNYRYGMAQHGSKDVLEAAHGVYQQVEPNHLLVYTWTWGGDAPLVKDTLVTVLFEELSGDQTRVTVTHERQPSAEVADIHQDGWTHMLADLVLHTRF